MTTSPAGRTFIRGLEGCSLTAYPDQKGIPTIGVGHTNGVKLGDTCTQEQADAWEAEDLLIAETAIEHWLPTSLALSQNQFDALVSLVFNIGGPEFKTSTVCRLLSQVPPDYPGACAAFAMWNEIKKNGVKQVDPGLVNRRKAEMQLFNTPDVVS